MALLSWLSTLFVPLFCDLDPARTEKIGNYELRFLKMKQIKDETGIGGAKTTQATPPPSPLPLPLPRFWVKKAITKSVTNQEIAKFWRQKRIDEEDHLLAAVKAAARMRAHNLSEEDYKRFEESLKDEDEYAKENNARAATNDSKKDEQSNEIRVGIKDWWTKSKYAYLNQPAIDSLDPPKRKTSSFIPNCLSFKPTPLYPTTLGVF